MTMEQAIVIVFAGGPGLAALLIQVMKHRSEKPEREANLAQTLTTTAGSMLDRMQMEIDALKIELRAAEDHIIKLEAKLETTQHFALEAAREREKRAAVELELERLRAYKSGELDERKSGQVIMTDSLTRLEESMAEAKEDRANISSDLAEAKEDRAVISSNLSESMSKQVTEDEPKSG